MNRSTTTSGPESPARECWDGADTAAPQSGGVDALVSRIRQALRRSGYSALSAVDIDVDRGCVTLRGAVRSFYLKQIATSLTLPLDGVTQLNNELTVTR